MNEDQADQIISILEDIIEKLSSIEMNTMDISSIESDTSEAVGLLRKISGNRR
mgnify:CR=1 FL=1